MSSISWWYSSQGVQLAGSSGTEWITMHTNSAEHHLEINECGAQDEPAIELRSKLDDTCMCTERFY